MNYLENMIRKSIDNIISLYYIAKKHMIIVYFWLSIEQII